MGYHVQVTSGNIVINKDKLEAAYLAMCALNETHDSEKRGGSFTNGKQDKKWFSWMSADFPKTCADAQAVLMEVGFETHYDVDGNLVIDCYDSKTGQEQLFLEAIAPFAKGHLIFLGEDGCQYKLAIVNDKLVHQEGKVVFQ